MMADEVRRLAGDAEAFFLPACLGLEDDKPLAALQAAVGKPIRVLPTLPPSVLGIRLHQLCDRVYSSRAAFLCQVTAYCGQISTLGV